MHPIAKEDDYWTETVWFGAQAAELGIGVNMFTLFRPKLGVMKLGIYIWEPGKEELWQLPYYRTFWHLPIPENIDATNFSLPVGYAITRIEPMAAYHLQYADGNACKIDLTFRSIHPAQPFGVSAGYGHLDQFGHVKGSIVVAGKHIPVDCIEMRDRTWAPRRETKQQARVAYAYGACSETSGFQLFTSWNDEQQQNQMTGGFVLTQDGCTGLIEGVRDVDRDAQGRPLRIGVRFTDNKGHSMHFDGEVVSRYAFHTTPYFVWMSVVRWIFPDGSIGYGQDQDTWSPSRYRRFLAEEL